MAIFLIAICFVHVPFFTDDVIYPKILTYGCCGAILVILGKGAVIKTTWNNTLIVSVLMLLLYIIIRHLGIPSIFIPTALTSIMLLLFFCNIEVSLNKFYGISFVVAVGMTIVCIVQHFGCMRFDDTLPISGMFDNPTGVSVLLSLLFPFILEGWIKLRKKSAMIGVVLIIACICFLQSRSGVIALLLSSLMLMYMYKRITRKRLLLLLGIGLFFLIYLFVSKSSSTFGRIFIYSNTLSLLKGYMLLGYGPWGYEANAMDMQAAYFMNNGNSIYASLAGESRHPLCEILLLLVNYGLVGFGLLIWVCYEVVKSWNLHHSVYHCCLLSMSIQSFFTYTFCYPSTWLITILCLSQIANRQNDSPKSSVLQKWCVVFVMLWSLTMYVKDALFEYKWYKSTLTEEADLQSFERMATHWNGNPHFFHSYAEMLRYEFQFERSNQMLRRYGQYIKDYSSQMMMADNFYAMKNYESALSLYKYAAYMCPVRFMPMRGMMRTYQKMHMDAMATQIAHDIIEKKPKINSIDIELIKYEAKKQIGQ